MALFTDGPAASVDDLTGQDSQLLDVATTEGIDITKKLALAHEELGIELAELLARAGSAAPAANVAVTPALKLWHALRTLELVYGDAYQNQLNDRYAGKRNEFGRRARWAFDKLAGSGIGMVWEPVPRAAPPTLAAAPGALPNDTYYVTMAWLNGPGEEGSCSPVASISLTDSGLMVTPATAPAAATAWNVYVGNSPDTMTRQNLSSNAPGQAWLQLGGITSDGPSPGEGQAPGYVQVITRILQRG
jgi:hypothetical protein